MSTRRNIAADLSPGVESIMEQLSHFDVDSDSLDLQGISDYVEALFHEMGSEDVGEITATAVSRGILSQVQGNKVVEVAMWCGQTEGKELSATIEGWLEEGSDPVKIELALGQSVFPFASQARMEEVLPPIATRFPQFAPEIKSMIERRLIQGV